MEVALFITCLTDTFYPRVGEAIVRVLRHYGCQVRFPAGQTCCGQPAYNSGFHAEAAALIRRMCDVFEPFEYVVSPSASCATMVKQHGPELLADDPAAHAAARRLAEKTWEFATFLRDVVKVDLARALRFEDPVTFHYPCHAREVYSLADLHGWLAGNGHDVRPPPHADLCCGFGGVFAVEFSDVSGAMLEDKLKELSATGAHLVVCNEAACGLQITGGARRHGLPLRVQHLAEWLAESLGLLEPES